jgi:uncharacterized protein YbjT (DUF2867 family)
LIGGYVVARLAALGHEVTGVGRRTGEAARRLPQARWLEIDLAKQTSARWQTTLQGFDAVVNCAGALQESPRDRLRAAHVDGVRALAEGARLAGVPRLVHVSAAGAEKSPGAFGAAKRDAEAAVRQAGPDWIILRPGLVLAPAAFGGSALLRGLAGFPLVIPTVHAKSKVQVVSAGDVSEAVAAAVSAGAPSQLIVDLVARQSLSIGEILVTLRAWLGLRPAPLVQLPAAAGRLVATVAGGLAWFGWRSPMRSASLEQLSHGVRGEAGAAERSLGVAPRSLAQILAAEPSGVQERWFARAYFLKPLILAVLSLFWIASGVIGLIAAQTAATTLTRAGFGAAAGLTIVKAGSVLDIALGIGAAYRSTARAALLGMLAASAAYMIGATLWRPDLWSDPMGPLLKILPMAALVCVALAIMDER